MKMTRILSIILGLTLASSAFALDIKGMNERVDELELDQEVLELDSYGEAALAENAKQESKEISAETRQLEREIVKMKRDKAAKEKRADKLVVKFSEKERLANAVEKKAKIAEREKNKVTSRVNKLQAKVDQQEKRAIKAVEERKLADKETARLNRSLRALEKRERVAQRIIKQNTSRRNTALAKAKRLSKKERLANQRVKTLERRASR
jgi:hypothetical protein